MPRNPDSHPVRSSIDERVRVALAEAVKRSDELQVAVAKLLTVLKTVNQTDGGEK